MAHDEVEFARALNGLRTKLCHDLDNTALQGVLGEVLDLIESLNTQITELLDADDDE